MTVKEPGNTTDPEEISIKDIAERLNYWRRYLFSKWKLIGAGTLIFAALGLAYTLIKKTVYVAESTFVLQEDNAGSSLGQYASLASLAGISVGDQSNGLFTNDNILGLYTSRAMLKKTLLSQATFNGKPELLINRYIDFNKLRNDWKGDRVLENVSFNNDTAKLSRLQDSVIFDIIKEIKKKNLSAEKPDKQSGIIDVQVSSKDELFAKCFNEKLVDNVNNLYISTKSAKAQKNLMILQQQTDSVRRILNSSISGAAIATDVVPNANPNMSVLHVAAEKKTVDVKASGEVYGQMLQNLELAKITLRRETPLIQIIDTPELPLEEEKPGKVLFTLIGAIVGFMIMTCYTIFHVVGRV